MLLLTLIGGVKFNVLNAQEDVATINGDATSYVAYYPICFNYNYGLSQHIYTSSDIGHAAGVIDKIAFKVNYTSTEDITLYMQNTDMTSFGSSYTKYISYEDNMVYSNNSLNTASVDGWLIIDIEDFEYDGTGLLITSVDNTGSSVYPASGQGIAYADVSEYLTLYKTSSTTFTPGYLNGTKRQPAIKLFFAASEPSVKITPESIDLGTVRTDANFFTEKPFEPEVVTVSAKGGAIINSIDTDDDFFKIEFEDEFTPGQDEYTLHINYNRNAETGSKAGNLVVTYDTDKTSTISLRADAYAATEGDAIEEPIVVAFNNNVFTHAAEDMHDDYILPDEENDGNNGDAVYKFTLENDAVLTASVTGNKPIVAIYKEFSGNEGPSSDNNYGGAEEDNQEPLAETSFSTYNFDNSSLEGWNTIDADGDGKTFGLSVAGLYDFGVGGTKCIESVAANNGSHNNYIVTDQKYGITETSTLTFSVRGNNYATHKYDVVISTTDNNLASSFTSLCQKTIALNSHTTVTIDVDLREYAGKNVYIGFRHYESSTSTTDRLFIDNIALTDGSAKSRSVAQTRSANQIDRVLYPAGTYYLVAAAEGDFTLKLSTEALPAPEAATLTAPVDEATEQNNPLLTWTLDKFAEKYQLLLGTTNPPTDVVVDWSAPATSYQTKGLANNTVYYWQVKSQNSVGETSSEVFSFVTQLNKPTNVTASKTNLYPGDETIISWEEADDATSYNVYVGETKVALEVTETSYTLSGLEYNVNPGHNVTVTANHTLGESAKSNAVVVKMTAKSDVTITVKNAAGTPVEGASVRIYVGQDQYGVAIAEQTFTTDANGQVNEQLLYLNNLYHYYIEVTKVPYATNTSETLSYNSMNNPTYSKEITLQLAAPTGLAVESDKLYPGDNLVVTWNAMAEADSYKVYVNGTEHGVANTNEYTIEKEDLEYNVTNNYNNGDFVQVKAVYDGIGESAISSEYKYFKVTGYGSFAATVNVEGATMKLEGTDEFGDPQTYTIDDDGNGNYAANEVLAGSYTATASAFGYNDATYNVTVTNGKEASCNFDMTEKPTAPEGLLKDVAVVEENNGDATVTWTGAYNKTQMYNIYRRNVETGVVEPVAENQNNTNQISKTYIDAAYATLDDGKYQYGVTTMVEKEVDNSTSFEDGDMPDGWIIKNNTGKPECDWTIVSNSTSDGVYSAYSYVYTSTTNEVMLISPMIDLTSVQDPKVSFSYRTYSIYGSGYSNYVYVKVSTSVDGPWEQIYTNNKVYSGQEWKDGSANLNNYVGKKIYVAFCTTINYCQTYIDNIVLPASKAVSESAPVWSNTIKKGGIVFTNAGGDNRWDNENNWSNNTVPGAEDEVTIKATATISSSSNVNVKYLAISGGALTINSGATLTVTGELVNNYEYVGLTINDGAQVFHNSENVKARFAMDIVAPETWSSENTDGWQFIAAPFVNNTAPIADFTSPNSSTIVYDLYKYNGVNAGAEWDNQKDNSGTWGYYFENGVGYLASYPEERTAYLNGTLNNASSHTWNFTYNNDEQPLANFHLLGNPFSFDMDMNNATFTNMVQGVAIVTAQGGYNYEVTSIPVGDGFFVKAINENPSFSYNAASKATRGEKANSLNITATGNAGKDNVVINFAGKSEGFNKLQNFNDAIATVYVAEDGKNYGIYNCDADVQEVELSFNANKMGNYTISIEPNGKFQTVTLVDHFTGVETNMLEGEYTFTAMSGDNHNRFVVRFANGQESTDDSHFVYQSGEELILNIQGDVQIVDVLGRVVYSGEAMNDINRINVSSFNSGAYMVRVMNGNDVKVEKVVIY